MTVVVFVVAADLKGRGEKCRVGNETARVCRKAVSEAQCRQAPILACAGRSDYFDVCMSHVMAAHIWDVHGTDVVVHALGEETLAFNTLGEVRRLIQFLQENEGLEEVVLVCRWWHMPRTRFYLRLVMRRNELKVKVRPVRVGSWHVLYMVREFLAWTKAIKWAIVG